MHIPTLDIQIGIIKSDFYVSKPYFLSITVHDSTEALIQLKTVIHSIV